jgi:hypothetical protein
MELVRLTPDYIELAHLDKIVFASLDLLLLIAQYILLLTFVFL